jgi:hypothetical protein
MLESSTIDFTKVEAVVEAAESIKKLGNKYFEKADHATALNFYVKVFLL